MKIQIVSLIMLSGIILAGCSHSPSTDDNLMPGNSIDVNVDTQAPVSGEETINFDAQIQADIIQAEREAKPILENAGTFYMPYAGEKVQEAVSNDKKVVIFFYAPWSPPSRNLEMDIRSNGVPENTIVFKTDYDTSTDLKAQYNVRSDTTVLLLNKNLEIQETLTDTTYDQLMQVLQ